MPLLPGRRLGPYEIVSALGAGGMGEVYEARDSRLGRTVALKVLPEGLAENPERRARFEREARTVSQLSHPHVCARHDLGEAEGIHFLVLEHCEGESLAERLGSRGALSLDDTLRHGAQIADALAAAHEHGVVHQDLKPANVAVDGEAGVKMLDFGLAKAVEPEPGIEAAGELAHSPTLTYRATRVGTLLGTAAYTGSEQARGKPADERSDLWAFGVVLWEMLSVRSRGSRGPAIRSGPPTAGRSASSPAATCGASPSAAVRLSRCAR